MEKGKLLDRIGANEEERLTLSRVLDRMEQAQRRSIPAATDFLSPQEQSLAQTLLPLAGAAPEQYALSGGYGGAERKMLLFLPDWLAPEDAVFPLRCLRAAYRAEEGLTHRDILGALMGLGIVREKVGDLLVGEDGCDLIVSESVAEYLLQNWQSAGRARLSVSPVEPQHLHIPVLRVQEVRDTVATLRLDAVAASGFRLSRGRAAELVESGRVQVNWRECVKPDRLLAQGDTVTARGLGKFVLQTVGGVTKKGRVGIVIQRCV